MQQVKRYMLNSNFVFFGTTPRIKCVCISFTNNSFKNVFSAVPGNFENLSNKKGIVMNLPKIILTRKITNQRYSFFRILLARN